MISLIVTFHLKNIFSEVICLDIHDERYLCIYCYLLLFIYS